MKERFISGLDIGTYKIAASMAKVDKKGNIDLLAIEESRSQGINRGLVTDLALLSHTIQDTMLSLRKKTSVKPDDVYAGIKGIHLTARHSRAVIPLLDRGNKVITSLDVRKVNNQARILGLSLEEDAIHEFAQNYFLDGNNRVENPLGLYGHKLEVDLFLITGKVSQIENLIKAVNNAGYQIKNLIFSGLAASFVTLTEEEKQKGCCLINIGSGSTEILTFQAGVLRALEIIPLGGSNLTEAIASALRLPFSLAEELKISYAAASPKDIDKDEDILVKKSLSYNPISRRSICQAIEPEVNRLIDAIKEKLDKSDFREYFSSDVVITGGMSLLYGFLEQLESKIGLPVRIAKIKQKALPSTKAPIYATTIGLLHCGIQSFLQDGSLVRKGKKGFNSFATQIKELYHEYF